MDANETLQVNGKEWSLCGYSILGDWTGNRDSKKRSGDTRSTTRAAYNATPLMREMKSKEVGER